MNGIATMELLYADFAQQSLRMAPAVDHEGDEADIYTDASCQTMVEVDVGGQTVPVAVEGEAYEASLAVEHRRTAIATGDVVVGEEAELHLPRARIGVWTEVVGREELATIDSGVV